MPPTPPYRRNGYTPVGNVSPSLVLVLPRIPMAAWAGIDIVADAGLITLSGHAVFSKWPSAPRDPSLDQIWFDFDDIDDGDTEVKITLSGVGVWLSKRWADSPTGTITLSGKGQWGFSSLFTGGKGLLTLIGGRAPGIIPTISTQGGGVGEHAGSNWLRWSKIGSLDFTQGRDNVAGQMPLPFKGSIYAILRRDTAIIVYAKNGIAILIPSGINFGHKVISNTGLKNKLAVIDTGDAHYYVDSKGRLYVVKEGLPTLLDYREWLNSLGSVAMAFNPDTRLLYIGDGTTGYVYNVDTGSFGKGPATVTGAGLQDGTLYVVASGTMTIPNFQIKTDVYDMGSRHGKSIQSLEASLDTTLTVEAAIDWRLQKQTAFSTTGWYNVDSRGQVFIPVYGYEFRFLFRSTGAGVFHLDSLQVNGVIHAH